MAGLESIWLTVCAMTVAILVQSTFAVPLSDRLPTGRGVAGEINAPQKHNYHSNLLELRKHIRGQNDSCSNISYNGQKLSSHLCDATAVKSFGALQMPTGDGSCNIKFSVLVKPALQELVMGADLSLYKLPEADANENTFYKISIPGDTLSDFPLISVEKKVPSTSHGWQVFSIDNTAINWLPGRNNFSILLTGIRSDGKTLPCSAVRSLFVMSSKEGHSSRTDKLQNYVPVVTTLVAKQGSALYCSRFPDTCLAAHRLRRTTAPHLSSLLDGNPRQRRSCENVSRYGLDMYNFRKEFRDSQCTAQYNGQSVSPHHCTTALFTFNPADPVISYEEIFCFIPFSFPQIEGTRSIGMDLALFKKETFESHTVKVFPSGGKAFFSPFTEKIIPAGKSGWQVFHVDSASENLTRTALFALLVQDSKGAFLTCDQLPSLFVLNYQEEEPEVEGSGAEGSELVPEDLYCEDYHPVITIFYVRLDNYQSPGSPRKRSTGKPTLPSLFIPQGCEVQDYVVDFLRDYGWDFIIQPPRVNVGLCSGHCAAGSGVGQTGSQFERLSHCKPNEYRSLDVLIRFNGVLAIEEISRFIIESCTCDGYP